MFFFSNKQKVQNKIINFDCPRIFKLCAEVIKNIKLEKKINKKESTLQIL